MLVVKCSESRAANRHARWVPLSELDDLELRNLSGLEPEIDYGDGFSLLTTM